MTETLILNNVEIREGETPRLRGVAVQEGRAAMGGRSELFAPGSVTWPSEGMGLRIGHGGPRVRRFMPVRSPAGEIRFSTPVSPEIREAVDRGQTGLSVEFVSVRERTTPGGVREIQAAYVPDVALVMAPEYEQGQAEIRSKERRNILWRI